MSVLLLHGALGSKEDYNQLKELLSKDFEVYTMNFYGHGNRFSEQSFDIDLFANDVFGFLDQNGIQATHVFGYSMGGYVGLKASLLFPERITSVLTYGTKFNWTHETSEKEAQKLNPSKMEEKIPAFVQQLSAQHPANGWKNVVEKTATMMRELGGGKAMNEIDFKRIEKNVVLGLGGLDQMVSKEETDYVAKVIPKAKVEVLEGQPHLLERTDLNILADFIMRSID